MIAPSDKDYKFARDVWLGRKRLPAYFAVLRDWLVGEYPGLKFVSAWYDKIEFDDRPRLTIGLEREEDTERFRDGLNYNEVEQSRIATQFRKIIDEAGLAKKFDTHKLFVVFSAFEPVARTEANWRVTKSDLAKLQKSLGSPEIWAIYNEWTTAVFFFHTDLQLRKSEGNSIRAMCETAYHRLVERYDELGVLKRRPIDIVFDSRENFDRTYGGDWFLYSRR